jgi:hypothetical protein
MGRQTLRDWVHDSAPPGLIVYSTSCAGDGSISGAEARERFGVEFHQRYVGKFLKKLGFSHMSARPPSGAGRADRRGAQKNFPRAVKAPQEGPPETEPVENWLEDEDRIGQKKLDGSINVLLSGDLAREPRTFGSQERFSGGSEPAEALRGCCAPARRVSGGGEAVEEDEPLHVVDEIGHADLYRGAGDAHGSDEELHLVLLNREDMLDPGADFGF